MHSCTTVPTAQLYSCTTAQGTRYKVTAEYKYRHVDVHVHDTDKYNEQDQDKLEDTDKQKDNDMDKHENVQKDEGKDTEKDKYTFTKTYAVYNT